VAQLPADYLVDILTGKQGAVIPKPHDLGFCFIATASTHKEFYGVMFAPQTNPASKRGFYVSKFHRRISLSF
jgi:hypothetical protein